MPNVYKEVLKTVKAAYGHINYIPIRFLHGYLMSPRHGVGNNDNNDASHGVFEED